MMNNTDLRNLTNAELKKVILNPLSCFTSAERADALDILLMREFQLGADFGHVLAEERARELVHN